MTERPSVVHDVEIVHAGQIHRASYFVEYNVVHARIGDRVLVVPVINQDPDTRVKDLLLDHVLSQARSNPITETVRPAASEGR